MKIMAREGNTEEVKTYPHWSVNRSQTHSSLRVVRLLEFHEGCLDYILLV
jgi:hypothetical protein